MKLQMKFTQSNQSFTPMFGQVNNVTDGGFERGYAEGYAQGNEDGKVIGYAEGKVVGHLEGRQSVVNELLGGAW